MRSAIVLLASVLVVASVGIEAAEARCRVSLPRADWKSGSNGGAREFQCRNESCGGRNYILRFRDDRFPSFKPGDKNVKITIHKPSKKVDKLPVFNGVAGTRMDHDHGNFADVVETYIDGQRMISFYALGPSRKMTRKNFTTLKNATKCW